MILQVHFHIGTAEAYGRLEDPRPLDGTTACRTLPTLSPSRRPRSKAPPGGRSLRMYVKKKSKIYRYKRHLGKIQPSVNTSLRDNPDLRGKPLQWHDAPRCAQAGIIQLHMPLPRELAGESNVEPINKRVICMSCSNQQTNERNTGVKVVQKRAEQALEDFSRGRGGVKVRQEYTYFLCLISRGTYGRLFVFVFQR